MSMFRRREAAPSVTGEAKKLVFGSKTPEEMAELKRAAAEAVAEKRELLGRIRAGHLTLADLFSDAEKNNERIQRLPVGTAVRALPGVSPHRANKILDEAGITKGRRIKGVGARQRERLLELTR